MANVEIIEQPPKQSDEETFVDKLNEEPVIPQSVNGMLMSQPVETNYEPLYPVALNHAALPSWQSSMARDNHRKDHHRKTVHGGFAVWQEAMKGYEWIELDVREQGGNNREEEELMAEYQWKKEPRVSWNHNRKSAPCLSDNFVPRNTADSFKHKPSEPHTLLMGGYPDVDYPSTQPGTLLAPFGEYQPTVATERPEFQALPRASLQSNLDSQSVEEEARRNLCHYQSGEEVAFQDPWTFSRKLKSPKLRRTRRPVSMHQCGSSQMSTQRSQSSGVVESVLNTNSSSNSDSDCSQKLKKNSASHSQSSDSLRVLKLGSLKLNQGMFWNIPDERVSPDPQTFSESELPDQNFNNKRLKLKTQRSASIPDIIIQQEHGLHLSSSGQSSTVPRVGGAPSPTTALDPQVPVSPLVGLLERARVRGQELPNMRAYKPSPSPSFSSTPSPSPSDGDRETDREWEEVELMRSRAPTVSEGWKEQLVDGEEEERRSSRSE